MFDDDNDSLLPGTVSVPSRTRSVKSFTQFRLRNLLLAMLLFGLVCGWIVDHRRLQSRRDADAIVVKECKQALLRRLQHGGIGRSIEDYPEVLLFAARSHELPEDYAQKLRTKVSPAGKVCEVYLIDLEPGRNTLFTFMVFTVDGTIVDVDDLSSEW